VWLYQFVQPENATMKRLVLVGFVLASMALSASVAEARGGRRGGCGNSGGGDCYNGSYNNCDSGYGCGAGGYYQTQVSWVDQPATAYKTEWKEKDVEVTTYKQVNKEVVQPMTRIVYVPEYKDVEQVVTTYQQVAKNIAYNVTCCRMVAVAHAPVACGNPCGNGCGNGNGGCGYAAPCVSYQPQYYTQQVTRTVYECVPVQSKVMVKVCSLKATEQKYENRYTVCELVPVKSTVKQRWAENVPYQTTVKVAVYNQVWVPAAPVAACGYQGGYNTGCYNGGCNTGCQDYGCNTGCDSGCGGRGGRRCR